MTYIKGIIGRGRTRKTPSQQYIDLDLNDEIPWGAHANRTVRWVLAHHPAYIAWLIEHGGDPDFEMRFVFSNTVKVALGVAKQSPDYDPDLMARDFYKAYRPLKVRYV